MRYPVILSVLLSMLIASVVQAARWTNDPETPSITTSGEATVYVKPDEVVINLGVETYNKVLSEAKSANDSLSKKLVEKIHDAGVEEKYIKTDVMQVEIIYPDGGIKNGIAGYLCRRAYAVTLKETGKFEEVINTALSNGANYLLGFEFRTTELRKHRDEARKTAIKAAKEKAVALAGELDMKVEHPHSITENAINYWGYSSGWYGWNRGGQNNYMAQNAFQQAPGGGGSGADGETMPLGQIAIHASVGVVFDMSPAK
jgi:uncharacterized protein YggE